MHEYCSSNISPKAVKELSGRIIDKLYDLAPEFDKTAKKHGRKTVMEEDVIEALGFADQDVIEIGAEE
jgi:histone H3/H4